MQTDFCPRIYALQPAYLSAPIDADNAGWSSHLGRCAAMGFDHVLVEPLAPGLTAGCRSQPMTASGLLELVLACQTRKLRLLLDLTLDELEAGAPLVQQHPSWFARRAGGHADSRDAPLPDPRLGPAASGARLMRFDLPEAMAALQEYWQQRIREWTDMGVAGFRCLAAARAPAAFWQTLIEASRRHRPGTRFLVWSCGCTPAQVAALEGCGFDASFSSAPWWDFKAAWFAEEQARLIRLAPPIAFPQSPAQLRPAHHFAENLATRRRLAVRALQFAAAAGHGWLLPMGFEYGSSTLTAAEGDGVADFDALQASSGIDLTAEIAEANALAATYGKSLARLRILSSPNAEVAMLQRLAPAIDAGEGGLLILANADPDQAQALSLSLWRQRAAGYWPRQRLLTEAIEAIGEPAENQAPLDADTLALPAAGIRIYAAALAPPVVTVANRNKPAARAATRAPRIAIEALTPAVDDGRFAVKRVLGETVAVEASITIDGHDQVAAALLWRTADQGQWQRIRMQPLGNDRWLARLPLARLGRHWVAIEAWHDVFSSYRAQLRKKVDAGLDVGLELAEGQLLLRQAAEAGAEHGAGRHVDHEAIAALKALAKGLAQATDAASRIQVLLSPPTAALMERVDARPFAVRSPAQTIDAERRAVQFASWYELFPRSQSGDVHRHGTFDDVIQRLPAIRAMGFDTLYLPPIHPIGRTHRKGRNNVLAAAPDDPGSPYAIGSNEGGHDAIHPQLGTLEDFQRLRQAAAEHGLELALDFAIQCSPDHPWLQQHPGWFDWRADGSIRYAENPPKKYEDIVSVNFYAAGATPDLWLALRDVVLFWAGQGVRAFRVDNPHTKPLPFWEWLIADICGRYPDTIFLSEAFTRPSMMYRLAKVGFSQSYTYFTWRHSKSEFMAYLRELTSSPLCHYFRPHFFVNTPDINPYFLQGAGRPGFLIRAALATTLSGLWGMYSGFELCEARALGGKEEYLDSEKYEIRAWDWQRPGNIIAEIGLLNRIRESNPALQTHLGIRFHQASDPNILYFSKATAALDDADRFGDNVILVAINLDPFAAHAAAIEVPLWGFGLADDADIAVEDLLHDTRFNWHGKHQRITLDPFTLPFAIWRLSLPQPAGV